MNEQTINVTISNESTIAVEFDAIVNTGVTSHNELTDIQGGLENQRYHINQSQLTNLGNQSGTNTGDQDLSNYATTTQLDSKVDKVAGKGLSTEDYTTVEKSKLASITAIFTTVLKTAYDTASDWITTNGANVLAHLSNTSNPHSVTKTQIGLSNVPNTDATTTANITDATNKRFVTDANLTTISNQSGTNTGDETLATIKSKLGVTTLSGSNTGDQDLSTYATIASLVSLYGKLLSVQSASTSVYSSAAKQTLFTFTLPSGSLVADGDSIEIDSLFQIDNTTGVNQTLTVGCDIGSTNLVTATSGTGLTGNLSNSTNLSVVKVYGIIKKTGTNTQRGVFHFDIGGRSLSYDFFGTAAENLSTDLAITLHITLGLSSGTFGFIRESFKARLLKAI